MHFATFLWFHTSIHLSVMKIVSFTPEHSKQVIKHLFHNKNQKLPLLKFLVFQNFRKSVWTLCVVKKHRLVYEKNWNKMTGLGKEKITEKRSICSKWFTEIHILTRQPRKLNFCTENYLNLTRCSLHWRRLFSQLLTSGNDDDVTKELRQVISFYV